ncbi:MAG: hypothetical protein ACHP7N_13150 [Caulobacterales bacterium]
MAKPLRGDAGCWISPQAAGLLVHDGGKALSLPHLIATLGAMGINPSWRMFRRMQYSAFALGALIYAAAVAHGWRVLPVEPQLKLEGMVFFPALYFLLTLTLPLAAPPLRRWLKAHIWLSFRTGFGQSVISVLAVVLVLATAAGFIYADTARATHGGRFPAGAFSAYAAGVGVLLAQALLVRRMERDPVLKAQIETAA